MTNHGRAVTLVVDEVNRLSQEGHLRSFISPPNGTVPGDAEIIAKAVVAVLRPEGGTDMDSQAIRDIALERATHVERGWTTQHDDKEGPRNLIGYAAERINDASVWLAIAPGSDPEAVNAHVRSQLVKAASIVVAAIEVMDRAKSPETPETPGVIGSVEALDAMPKGSRGTCSCGYGFTKEGPDTFRFDSGLLISRKGMIEDHISPVAGSPK